MFIMKVNRFFILLIILLTVSACGVTTVHELGSVPRDQVAFIEGVPGWNPLSVITVQVYSIDGKKVIRSNNVFEVRAGEHEIEIMCRREQPEFIQRHFSFKFILKAGHRYKPRLDMTKDCHVDYIDKATGKKYTGTES